MYCVLPLSLIALLGFMSSTATARSISVPLQKSPAQDRIRPDASRTKVRVCTDNGSLFPSPRQVRRMFKRNRIVDDVIPHFKPIALLYLTYNGHIALPGSRFEKEETSSLPTFSTQRLPANPSHPYLLIVVDPDAPSRDDPKWAPVRHFLAANFTVSHETTPNVSPASASQVNGNRFKGNSRPSDQSVRWILKNSTSAATEYKPPAPPAGTGPHRYVALLYDQPEDLTSDTLDDAIYNASRDGRQKFNLTMFLAEAELGHPVAGTFFTVEVPEDAYAADKYDMDGIAQTPLQMKD